MTHALKDYEEQVYAGVLGKIIGVYIGRPVEGWDKVKIEEKLGTIDRYVHEENNVALVVADDDISGTLTFIRALEDSGGYADTPDEDFGKMWLNYLIEHKTVLWWGGMGVSTEHTAFLRLKEGVSSPGSGSCALNGKVVSEQIGGQIFIDAFGWVAPDRPDLAVRMAERSARVSHDGEGVYGALVVAAMCSAAFSEKRMDKLLDIGVRYIPKDSTIAKVHKTVRAWCKKDKNWHKTYQRIKQSYGYRKFGGGCHMVPNHALMVMAWAYAQDDFHKGMAIINTAGWDTDCNSGNVGAVMGVQVGLKGILKKYDFQSPFADRIYVPTAEGTRGISDVLQEALYIAGIGRRVMKWQKAPAPKGGAFHHFDMPGALHGYMAEEDSFDCRGTARVDNIKRPAGKGSYCLRVRFQDLSEGRVARVSTPMQPAVQKGKSTYKIMSTPRLYTGMHVTLHGSAGKGLKGKARARLFIRYFAAETKQATGMAYSKSVKLKSNASFKLNLTVPETKGWPVKDLGIELTGEERAKGELLVDALHFGGKPTLTVDTEIPVDANGVVNGWVSSLDFQRTSSLHWAQGILQVRLSKSVGRGLLVTGNTDWTDYTFEAELGVHMAREAGVVVRYQGLERYIAVVKTQNTLKLVSRYYEDEILAEKKMTWPVDKLHKIKIVCKGKKITAYCKGKKLFESEDRHFGKGGVGFLVDSGIAGVRTIRVR